MESLGVLMLIPMNSYLEQELWLLQIKFRARKSQRERERAMAASRVSSCIAMATTAATSLSRLSNRAYADGPLKSKSDKKAQAEDSSKSFGFDPESLERGAKALFGINNSPYSKQVFLRREASFFSVWFLRK
nr:hypothetical protein CFP56_05772 [Quercus suber]